MSRSFYYYAIFFSCLYVVTAFVSFQAQLRFRDDLLTIPAFTRFLVVVMVLSLASQLLTGRYYFYKKYWFSFIGLILIVWSSLCYLVVMYSWLTRRELGMFLMVVVAMGMITNLIHAISLIFSRAKERTWLRMIGFLSTAGTLAYMTLTWLAMSGDDFQAYEGIAIWVTLGLDLLQIGYVMNFRSELLALPRTGPEDSIMFKTVFFLIAVVFAVNVTSASYRLLTFSNAVPEFATEAAKNFDEYTFVGRDGEELPYRLMLPLDFDSTKKYPLVVCLHGASGTGRDNVTQIVTCVPAMLIGKEVNRQNYPAFVFVPQCPPGRQWGGLQYAQAVDSLVFQAIEDLESKFPIDKGRRYIAGNSMGGTGAWHLISMRPDFFAAAIPISGAGNPAYAEDISRVPVWAFHGEDDTTVPVSGSREIIEAMESAGGYPRYTEFKGKGHNITQEFSETPGVLDWLFSQANTNRAAD